MHFSSGIINNECKTKIVSEGDLLLRTNVIITVKLVNLGIFSYSALSVAFSWLQDMHYIFFYITISTFNNNISFFYISHQD